MNDTWKPPNLYTLDWHAEACKAYAEGKPTPPSTGEPCKGYYRATMYKDGGFVPVRYLYERNTAAATGYDLWCELNCGRTDNDYYWNDEKLPNGKTLHEFWTYASKHPITQEQYTFYQENGHWPEVLSAIHELTNNPPDDNSAEALEDQINSLEEEAKRLLANAPAKNQEECNQASVLVGKLNEWFQYDGDREWLKNRTRMDARITPEVIVAHETYTKVGMSILNSVKRCEIFKRLKQDFQKPFLVGLKAAAARVGEKMPVQHAVLGYPATHLSTRKKAKIKDRKACLEHYINNAKLDTLLQSLADAEVKSTKKAPPGCEVVEEDIAS